MNMFIMPSGVVLQNKTGTKMKELWWEDKWSYKGSIHIHTHTFCSGRYCHWSWIERGGTAQDPTKCCGEDTKWAAESKQGSQNSLQRVTHLPSMPQTLLWCQHSNKLYQKSEEKEEKVRWRPARKLVTPGNTGLGHVMLDAISGFGN